MKYEDKLAAGRCPCVVPGCRKTFKPEGHTEVLCREHWRRVPAYMRRRLSKLQARYRRRMGGLSFWEYPAGSPRRLEGVKLANMCDAAWRLCRRAAIERALGL